MILGAIICITAALAGLGAMGVTAHYLLQSGETDMLWLFVLSMVPGICATSLVMLLFRRIIRW